MSSNVLKNLNDCYNFTDDTNSGNKTKGRQKLKNLFSKTPKSQKSNNESKEVPKSVVKESTKRDHKWRCDAFKEILNTAVWLNNIRAETRQAIDRVVDLLNKHISDECKCVNICTTHLLVGNTYFERFLFNQKEFENKVINEENKFNDMKTNDVSKNSTFNDIPVQKESKLETDVMPHLVNFNNMSSLLSPLEEAVNHWKQAFELSLKYRILTEDAVIDFKIYNNLSSVVQIYAFYGLMESRLKAVQLLNSYCRYYGSKYSEISLTANYYLVRAYIELGAIKKATICVTPRPLSSKTDQLMAETFGKSLNLLANIEIDLLNGKTEKAAKMLRQFIGCDYLQKLTINRYYVKGMALLLTTKFSSKAFKFSKYFAEFLEPIHMSVSILKRWNPWLSTTSGKNNENQMINSGDLDPIWYKFGVMNYSFDAMQMSSHFYGNIEMPVDAVYYFNALFKLGRHYCATVRLSKLLIVGSHLDMLCDYKLSAQTKLSNALQLIGSKRSSSSSSVFDSCHSSTSTISPLTKRAIHGSPLTHRSDSSDSEIEIIEIKDENYESKHEECQHNQRSTLWDIKKRLRGGFDSDDSELIPEIGRNMRLNPFESIEVPKGVLELFFIRMEIEFCRLLITETDPKYVLSQISDIHKNSFESFASNVFKSRIQELINDYSFDDFLFYCDYYKSLKFQIFETMARLQLQLKEYEDVINTCDQMRHFRSSSYVQRISQSNLLYFEAFSRLELYKTKHNITNDKVWVEFKTNVNDFFEPTNEQSVTPTRPQTKVMSFIPKAPKHKHFPNEEIEDYVKALSKCVYEESKGVSSDSTQDRNPFRMKSYTKLNFENDSELRSLSVTENSLLTNDGTISKDLSSKLSTKIKTNTSMKITERMTRSRTSSLKSSSKYFDCVSKVEKRSKRSTAKSSSKSTTKSSEVIDVELEFKEQMEDLDEVFLKNLSINESKTNEKSSETELSIESIIKILKKINDLVSSHPTSKLYNSIHKLLTEIYSISDESNEQLIGYHFSESIRSSYRYRKLFISEKKRKLNKVSKYDLNSIVFSGSFVDPNVSHKIFTDCLPNDWRVVQIMTVENETKIPELMVCRYQSGRNPLFLKIKSDPQKIIKHFMTQFVEIIERSNASIVNKDRETFWRLRYSLDEELMILLRSVEETWFGPFKGILFGQLQNQNYQNMCQNLESFIMGETEIEGLVCESQPLLQVLVESLPSLKYIEFRAAMKMLFKCCSDQLISMCFAKYEQMFCEVYPMDNKESIFTTFMTSPLGLILEKSLDSFPFECLPTVQSYNQSFFRTPSLRILSLMYNTFKDGLFSKGVDQSKAYYVLNPSDNLPKTEEYFKNTFLSIKEWEGVIGKAPNPLQLKEAFGSKEAYIFFGHGAGTSYYRAIPDGLDACDVNCASLVIGCSSGRLFSEGQQLDSHGTAFRFLMNGCPSYVGVLWDVTDKDIDKFSDQLLSYLFSKWKPELNQSKEVVSNTKAVAMSRRVCRLKYLIGAAPVVYGLPLFTKI